MKRLINFIRPFKALLLAGLLAGPILSFNVIAAEADMHWSPSDVLNDGNGDYAYFADPNNWDSRVVSGSWIIRRLAVTLLAS